LTRKEAIIVLGIVCVLYSIQAPRALAILLRAVPPLSRSEQPMFPDSSLQRVRAKILRSETHDHQIRALARIDLARPIARRLRASPEALRKTFADVLVPGTIEGSMVELLDLPPVQENPETNPARLRSALGHLLRREPETRPFWLNAKESWPPPT
jgi:hypothetical protein